MSAASPLPRPGPARVHTQRRRLTLETPGFARAPLAGAPRTYAHSRLASALLALVLFAVAAPARSRPSWVLTAGDGGAARACPANAEVRSAAADQLPVRSASLRRVEAQRPRADTAAPQCARAEAQPVSTSPPTVRQLLESLCLGKHASRFDSLSIAHASQLHLVSSTDLQEIGLSLEERLLLLTKLSSSVGVASEVQGSEAPECPADTWWPIPELHKVFEHHIKNCRRNYPIGTIR